MIYLIGFWGCGIKGKPLPPLAETPPPAMDEKKTELPLPTEPITKPPAKTSKKKTK